MECFLPRFINNVVREIDLPNEVSGAVVIPIPMHRIRQRDRGFNQAQAIASKLVKQWNIMVDYEILKRENIQNHKLL